MLNFLIYLTVLLQVTLGEFLESLLEFGLWAVLIIFVVLVLLIVWIVKKVKKIKREKIDQNR